MGLPLAARGRLPLAARGRRALHKGQGCGDGEFFWVRDDAVRADRLAHDRDAA